MAEGDSHRAPIPVRDVVPGDPPVPITVWPVPAPGDGETMSNAMGVRLVYNFTHPSGQVIDLTTGPQLARAVIAAHRRSHLQAARQVGWGTGYWHVAGTPVVEYAAMGWDECLTELLVQLGDRGLVAIVKMGGERPRGRWTVLVSGKPLGAEPGQWEPVR